MKGHKMLYKIIFLTIFLFGLLSCTPQDKNVRTNAEVPENQIEQNQTPPPLSTEDKKPNAGNVQTLPTKPHSHPTSPSPLPEKEITFDNAPPSHMTELRFLVPTTSPPDTLFIYATLRCGQSSSVVDIDAEKWESKTVRLSTEKLRDCQASTLKMDWYTKHHMKPTETLVDHRSLWKKEYISKQESLGIIEITLNFGDMSQSLN